MAAARNRRTRARVRKDWIYNIQTYRSTATNIPPSDQDGVGLRGYMLTMSQNYRLQAAGDATTPLFFGGAAVPDAGAQRIYRVSGHITVNPDEESGWFANASAFIMRWRIGLYEQDAETGAILLDATATLLGDGARVFANLGFLKEGTFSRAMSDGGGSPAPPIWTIPIEWSGNRRIPNGYAAFMLVEYWTIFTDFPSVVTLDMWLRSLVSAEGS